MKPNKDQENLANFFTALGHKRRLMICDILLRYGQRGMSFEMLQTKTKMAASTLTHHLTQMQKGNIIRRKEKGRYTFLYIDLSGFNHLPNEYSKRLTQISQN